MARATNPSGGGTRQQRAAELKAEEERRKQAAAKEAAGQSTDDPNDDDAPSASQQASGSQETGAIGQGDYMVKQGDCVSAIACRHGFFWKTLWELPENSELNSVRGNPNVLLPGDRITIPELRPKEESGATEAHHRFRRLGEPSILRLRFLKDAEEEEAQDSEDSDTGHNADTFDGGDPEYSHAPAAQVPRVDVPYALIIDGTHYDGFTDEDGCIEVAIPGSARRGKLILNPGTDDEETMSLNLGTISPITELVGVKERLLNLAFDCGHPDGDMTPDLMAALRAFQEQHGLTPTGEADDATRAKLVEMHGC